MSDKYKIRDMDKTYFIIPTAVRWTDVFSPARKYAELDYLLDVCLVSSK